MDLVAFYQQRAADHQGRTLAPIWDFDDDVLEATHDYIQVLFPLPEPSQFNHRAPLLDDAVLAVFRSDAVIQGNLQRSLDRMLAFYGFERDGAAIVEGPRFHERSNDWLVYGDHNHLRITRILRCLTLCGLREEAAAFLAALAIVRETHPDDIAPASFDFWTRAVATA
jgi:hypothetical protein